MIDPTIKKNRYLLVAGLLQLIYGGIEILDCLTVLLVAVGVLANPYPPFIFAETNRTFEQHPLAIFALFVFFTHFRIFSGVGVLRNRAWGFWAMIFSLTSTVVMTPLFLPLSGIDIALLTVIMSCLLLGYFKDRPLMPPPPA